MLNRKDRIRGMIVGGAIGDALGMPVETWSRERIFEMYPEGIRKYHVPSGHKWFNPETMPAGMTTDDTQLTIATAKGILASTERNYTKVMDLIALEHVVEFVKSTACWGYTTRESIRRLANGTHWSECGKTDDEKMGWGNGVPMKCAPLAAWFINGKAAYSPHHLDFLIKYSAMTHYTQMSAEACIIHTYACFASLFIEEISDVRLFVNEIMDEIKPESLAHLNKNRDDLLLRMKEVYEKESDKIIGTGYLYVYESLPLAHSYFLNHPTTLETICKVAEAGGDTDTNAKMCGELIGAMRGLDYFNEPENRWSIEGLKNAEMLIDVADQLYSHF